MAVAKRQGRFEDQSEDFRQNKQNKQHSWLSPICIGQAQVGEKHIKGGAKVLSQGLSLPRACARARSLSLPRAGALPTSLLFVSLGQHALMPRGWILLLFSK